MLRVYSWTPKSSLCENDHYAGGRTCRVTSLLLGLVTTATIVGNVFVMVAIGVERHLRVNVANYLIASLAVADLLVAALVMPLAAVNDVTRGWPLGRPLCDAWVPSDVPRCVTLGCRSTCSAARHPSSTWSPSHSTATGQSRESNTFTTGDLAALRQLIN